MPRRRRSVVRRPLTGATAAYYDIELWCGISTTDLPFDERDQEALLEQAWELRRDELLAQARETHPGSRPWAWWWFERDQNPPEGRNVGEALALLELGELDEDETAAIFARADDTLRRTGPVYSSGLPAEIDVAVALADALSLERYTVSETGGLTTVRHNAETDARDQKRPLRRSTAR